ncbi:hypothetical protein AB0M68_38050 [Streptomyces sp. NPDC051453]|uniref:hypothetical protein n=1 Tax=Streptomyces sp. NPDC051453 TaxID=3154941 RepID=UPI0034477EF2
MICQKNDWVHLRTIDPIESTFSIVKLRGWVTGGAGGSAAALAMVFELTGSAQARRRAITAPRPPPSSARAPASNAPSWSSVNRPSRHERAQATTPLLFPDVDGPLLLLGHGPQYEPTVTFVNACCLPRR